MLARYGAETWFQLGDRDVATHIRRSQRLREGVTLSEVTTELALALAVPARLLPMSDEPVRTEVRSADGWLEFQDWFVRRGQRDAVLEIRSPNDESYEKLPFFAKLGVREVVIIDPDTKRVEVFALAEGAYAQRPVNDRGAVRIETLGIAVTVREGQPPRLAVEDAADPKVSAEI